MTTNRTNFKIQMLQVTQSNLIVTREKRPAASIHEVQQTPPEPQSWNDQ